VEILVGFSHVNVIFYDNIHNLSFSYEIKILLFVVIAAAVEVEELLKVAKN
jgi:hypothetical protein